MHDVAVQTANFTECVLAATGRGADIHQSHQHLQPLVAALLDRNHGASPDARRNLEASLEYD
jgi:hypothetical protein